MHTGRPSRSGSYPTGSGSSRRRRRPWTGWRACGPCSPFGGPGRATARTAAATTRTPAKRTTRPSAGAGAGQRPRPCRWRRGASSCCLNVLFIYAGLSGSEFSGEIYCYGARILGCWLASTSVPLASAAACFFASRRSTACLWEHRRVETHTRAVRSISKSEHRNPITPSRRGTTMQGL